MDKYFTPEDYKDYWERCPERMAHLWTDKDEIRPKRWDTWLPWFDFKDKVVVDYGCGGAYLYDVIKHKIKRYIGIDISERSLLFAENRLRGIANCEFYRPSKKLSELSADILVCQQVITHFGYQDMMDEFLENVKLSSIPKLMLEILEHSDPQKCEFESAITKIHSMCAVGTEYIVDKIGYALTNVQKNDQYSFTKWEMVHIPKQDTEKVMTFTNLESIVDRASLGITNMEHRAIEELADIASIARRIMQD